MYPHGARPALTPSVSRPRVMAMPILPPVPLHVTSSRKVHRSADGIINIIQEISFYAEGGVKGLAGKQLKEVHSHPPGQERGRFSAETNARVFVGERLIRMHIQTAIRPNTSDSLEIDEVFHFAENNDAVVVPIAFEATLEREEGEKPAVEFDLSSMIIVSLKQRILKDPGEQYKVLQAIELRANDSDTRPTQELARKTTLSQPSNDSAQFRERIFAGTDVLRVDRDIIFVCDRPILALSERREYTPAYPVAPRRRSASLTQSAPRVRHTPNKPRSRSQSRSWTDSENCATANEDLPTATSPYSLYQDESNSRIPPYVNTLHTARDHSPVSSNVDSSRTSRSKRKKWTVNSVVSKADARTPERYDRARTMRSLDIARNLSLSPLNRSPDRNLKTAHARSPNGEIPAIHAIPIVPTTELGPHGESQLVEGMDLLKVAAPVDSLMRTCADGSPRRSASNCSTAGEIPASASTNNYACQSPPFSSPRVMPATAESSAPSTRPCTPLRTARQESPRQRAPSSAALDKRRGLFGYGVRPATSPMRSARSPAPKTALEASPMRTAQRVVLSPVQTAVRVNSSRGHDNSQKSLKDSKKSNRSGRREAANARLMASDYRSSTNLNTARNLFGTVPSNESVARMFTARTPTTRTGRDSAVSPALVTARPQLIAVSPEKSEKEKERELKCPHSSLPVPPISSSSKPLRIETWSQYDGSDCKFGKHGPTETTSPYRPLERSEARTARSPANVLTGRGVSPARAYPSDGMRTGAERSPARGLKTARDVDSPMGRRVAQPRMLFGDVLTSPSGAMKTARPPANSPYEPAYERSAPNLYYSGEKIDDDPKTARAHSHHDDMKSARSPTQTLNTAKHSPYEKNVMTAGESRSPMQSMKTARYSPYEKTACDISPARDLPTGRGHTDRSPSLVTGRPRSPYDTATARETRSPALNTARHSPYGENVQTGRESRSPAQSMKTARHSPYEKSARDGRCVSPARDLPTGRGHTDRSPSLATGRPRSPYETRTAREARSPALNTAVLSPYEQKVFTAHSARSPMHSTKTARNSDYEKTAQMADRSPAQVRTAVARDASPYETTSLSPVDGVSGRSPSIATARKHSPTPRSLYLSPLMAKDNAAILEQQNQDDGAYTQVVTARAVSPFKVPQDVASPLRPSMTARGDPSTMTCVSGGVDTNARWTARSARSPKMSTSRNNSASPMRTARSGYAAPTTTPTHSNPQVMDQLPNMMQPHELSRSPQQQNTAVYGGGAGELLATSRTQSPATRSSASNVNTAVGVRSPHVDTESPNNLATARSQRGDRDRQVYGAARSPVNVRTARETRSSSRSPAARTQLRTANSRTPEHNTMPDSQLRQEDSYSEQSQFTYQKTPSGYTQKPTHSNEVSTGQQRTPTKTDTASMYYSARQTTPSRTIRPDDVTLTKRTPKRDFSQHAGLESSRSPLTRTAVGCTPKKQPKVEEIPKCSLKSGCQVTHTPRIIPAGPDSDKDSPTTRSAVAAKTPERSVRTARGLPATRPMTPKAPFNDMRTPRTARASKASPASSLLRSPAPSSHMITAISPDAASNSNNSNEDVVTARRPAVSPSISTTRRNWAAATTEPPTVAAASKPRVIVRANQADGKIHVEVCLSFKLNTTGTIRVRGEMVPSLHPRTVSVNGQQIWSDSRH